MLEVLNDILSMMGGGIVTLGEKLATGANKFVTGLLTATNASGDITGASMFAMGVALFAGIGLTVGLTTRLFNWIQSLGN